MIDFIPLDNSLDVFTTEPLKNALTNVAVTDAILTFTIYDSSGNALSGATAVSMPHVGDGGISIDNGHYRGTVDLSAVSLSDGSRYKIVVSASNYAIKWERVFPASNRPFGV
jgi:hypothetical protein